MIRAAEPGIKTCYLKPGEIHLTLDPSLVTTVLGSCLSITMHHRPTRMSVICHAVMPSIAQGRDAKKDGAFQYVDSSLQWMIEQYTGKGIRLRDIEVKMFGGAAIFQDTGSLGGDMNIGKRNVEAALAFLKRHRIPLKAWNVGGNRGRKLIFNTLTGDVLAKFITKTHASQIDSGGRK